MIGVTGFAFLNHGDETMDMEPLWLGIVPWTLLLLIVAGIQAIFG